jgi:hypothetical protein
MGQGVLSFSHGLLKDARWFGTALLIGGIALVAINTILGLSAGALAYYLGNKLQHVIPA